jgi:hypothetical protein
MTRSSIDPYKTIVEQWTQVLRSSALLNGFVVEETKQEMARGLFPGGYNSLSGLFILGSAHDCSYNFSNLAVYRQYAVV